MLQNNDSFKLTVKKLRQQLATSNEFSDTSSLFPYGRVTASEARAKQLIRHEAAVTIVAAPVMNRLSVLFIKRNNIGIHGRQIAFPGGRREIGESFENTAIRELQEETGVRLTPEDLVCKLQEIFIVPSQFMVQPYAAILEKSPIIIPNAEEIESVFWVDLKEIAQAKTEPCEVTTADGKSTLSVNAFILNNEIIWGATAIMLEDFRYRIKKALIEP